jgi:hypothetical protein
MSSIWCHRERFKAESFLIYLLDPLLAKIFPEERRSHELRLSAHLDNCRVQCSNTPKSFVDENALVNGPHPPYRPDLVRAGLTLFGHMEKSFAGRVFNDFNELH